MKILAVESSAASSSCALWADGRICADMYTNVALKHSRTLMPMVSEMLSVTGTSAADIDLFAVSAGPGSFTGVRIGIAAVKGLAFPWGKPCAAVSALETAAYGARMYDGTVCAVMDARRNQVYNAIFECSGSVLSRVTADRAVSVDKLGEELAAKNTGCLLVGDGAEMCYNKLADKVNGVILAPENIRFQRAAAVAALAYEQYLSGKTVPAEELVPVYLRLPQAERELLEKKGVAKNDSNRL